MATSAPVERRDSPTDDELAQILATLSMTTPELLSRPRPHMAGPDAVVAEAEPEERRLGSGGITAAEATAASGLHDAPRYLDVAAHLAAHCAAPAADMVQRVPSFPPAAVPPRVVVARTFAFYWRLLLLEWAQHCVGAPAGASAPAPAPPMATAFVRGMVASFAADLADYPLPPSVRPGAPLADWKPWIQAEPSQRVLDVYAAVYHQHAM